MDLFELCLLFVVIIYANWSTYYDAILVDYNDCTRIYFFA